MRYVKPISLFSILTLCAVGSVWGQTQLTACQEQGKKEFASRDYVRAGATFERCLKLDPTNEETLLSLAGVALTQDQLTTARKYFLSAIRHMKRVSPYRSYTYSMLGDIAFKQQKNKEALSYYEKSLEYNRANVNSLVGKAVIVEEQGKPKEAAQLYETALSVEPLNEIARRRLIALEPIYFTDDEMLAALKQRYAALPDKKELSQTDRDLFTRIHSAEQHGGIDYLKSKYKALPSEYVVTLFKGTGFERDVLTISGYNALRKQVGQDALAVFQKMGVRTQDVFDLRDMKGHKIFLEDSTLNDSGMYVYNEALRGRKAFLLPKESVPPSQKDLEKLANLVQGLQNSGYTEISPAELAFVKQQTNCSEDTLRQYMGLYIVPVSKTDRRYFVPEGEVPNPRKGAPYYYVALLRSRSNPAVKVPRNSLAETYAAWNYKLCSAVDGQLLEM